MGVMATLTTREDGSALVLGGEPGRGCSNTASFFAVARNSERNALLTTVEIDRALRVLSRWGVESG